jgi:hypothetical protein
MSSLVDLNGNPVQENEEMEEETETTSPASPEDDEIACAYVVGIKKSGEFVFEVSGEDPGLVQLLGLHEYAHHRLMFAKDINQGYGFPVVMKQLNQIGQMLQVLLNMATQQSKKNIDFSVK